MFFKAVFFFLFVFVVTDVCLSMQGEVGEHGQKGAKGAKGEHVSDAELLNSLHKLKLSGDVASLFILSPLFGCFFVVYVLVFCVLVGSSWSTRTNGSCRSAWSSCKSRLKLFEKASHKLQRL